jgi:two-component system response regulator HydG
VDVRILAATNRDLMEEVKAGRFREDLYYRLNVVPIRMPALRERHNDIPLLARHFLEHFAAEQGKILEGFSSEALRGLLTYDWPGNVRELENSVEHATVLAKGNTIDLPDLPEAVTVALKAPLPQEPPKAITANEERLVRKVLEECDWNKTAAAARLGISRSTLYEKLKRYGIARPTVH